MSPRSKPLYISDAFSFPSNILVWGGILLPLVLGNICRYVNKSQYIIARTYVQVQRNRCLSDEETKVEDEAKTEFGNYEEGVFELQAKVNVFKG